MAYDKDYYQQLKDENYKTLWQSEIQLDNARQRAMKNTQTQLAGQGMASSGMGSTVRNGLENQYLTGMQNAQQNFQNQNAQINQQEKEAIAQDANDRFNSLTTLMSGAQTNDELNAVLGQYGYGTVGADGKFAWNQDKLNQMQGDDALQLQSLYGMYDSQLRNNATAQQEANFNNIYQSLSNSDFTSLKQLEEWKDAFVDYDNLTDTQKKQFDFLYNEIKGSISSNKNGESADPSIAPSDYFAQAEGMEAGSDEYKLTIGKGNYNALKNAGLNAVCLGFPKAYDKDSEGLGATMTSLREYGMEVYGTFDEPDETGSSLVQNVGNIKVAILQYTSDISSNSTKLMKKRDEKWAVAADDPDAIANDIVSVRAAGADVVVVCLHWGKPGNKSPNKKQKELAQKIADAGADIIIGAGSRVVQNIEYLTVDREDGTKGSVLCAWSLGCLMSESRDAGRVAGILLKLTVSEDAEKHISIQNAEYIPTYIWQYKQDGITYYRTIAADRNQPDGLSGSDEKNMEKAVATVSKALADSPVKLAETD